MPTLDYYANLIADFQGNPDSESEIVLRFNNSGSIITKGSVACLDRTATGVNLGLYATIPDANNLSLFEGVWLGTFINGVLSDVPIAEWGLVQRKGIVRDPSTLTGLARVLGVAGLSAVGLILTYTAGSNYFSLATGAYSDVDQQVARIVSGEAWTTASVGYKLVILR